MSSTYTTMIYQSRERSNEPMLHDGDNDNDDNDSLAMSLESFDHERLLHSPSLHSHSAYRSDESGMESDRSSAPWSPPAWRKSTSGWQQRHSLAPPGHGGGAAGQSASSRVTGSPRYSSCGDGDETLLPAMVPLPASPEKESPEPARAMSESVVRCCASGSRSHSRMLTRERSLVAEMRPSEVASPTREKSVSQPPSSSAANAPSKNFMRFSLSAEVQQRTEPIEAMMDWARSIQQTTKTKPQYLLTRAGLMALLCAILIALFRAPDPLPTPDILQATQVAKSFEPMIYYSESTRVQITEIQDSSIAVWDLGESIRGTNMTSGPIIVKQLDELSASLERLVVLTTDFFVNVDGDIDSILYTMEWAKKRLQTIELIPTGSMSAAKNNVHGLVTHTGLLGSASGTPNAVGKVMSVLFGQTAQQRNTATLHRTFNQLLNTLEESIKSELHHANRVYELLEAIGRQFTNIRRTAELESEEQAKERGDMLSSLWTKIVGPRAAEVHKFERNRLLLASITERTILSKRDVGEHSTRLLTMKTNLNMLRQRLATPLLRGNGTRMMPVDEQIQGLDDTYQHLRGVREQQKQRRIDALYKKRTID